MRKLPQDQWQKRLKSCSNHRQKLDENRCWYPAFRPLLSLVDALFKRYSRIQSSLNLGRTLHNSACPHRCQIPRNGYSLRFSLRSRYLPSSSSSVPSNVENVVAQLVIVIDRKEETTHHVMCVNEGPLEALFAYGDVLVSTADKRSRLQAGRSASVDAPKAVAKR